jgi:broad specificity phosphatase PhoE
MAGSRYLRVVQTRKSALKKAGKRFRRAPYADHPALDERIKGARMGFGSGVGMTKGQLWKRYPAEMAAYQSMVDGGNRLYARLPGAETPRELQARIESDIFRLVETAEVAGKKLLVLFTHGTVGRMAMMSLCRLPDRYYEETPSLPQGSISMIQGDLSTGFSKPVYLYNAPPTPLVDALFIRHGKKARVDRAKTPNHMAKLTDRGKEQAKATGKALKGFLKEKGLWGEPDQVRIVFSPYRRAVDTKDIIVKQLGKKMKRVPQVPSGYLGEKTKGFGAFWDKDRLRELFPVEMSRYDAMKSNPETAADAKLPGNGESINETKLRIVSPLRIMMREGISAGVKLWVFVGHGGANRAAVMGLCGLPNRWYGDGATQPPASILHLQCDPDTGFDFRGYLFRPS